MLNGASKCMLTPPPRVLGKGTKNPRDPISAQRIGTLPKEDPVARSVMFADTDAVVPCHVLAERIMILADHSQTGSYEVLVHDAPEGAGPPPHSHPGTKRSLWWMARLIMPVRPREYSGLPLARAQPRCSGPWTASAARRPT